MFLKISIGIILTLSAALAWQTFQLQGTEAALAVAVQEVDAAKANMRVANTKNQIMTSQLELSSIQVKKAEQERRKAKAEVDELRELFDRHDFANLIKTKPGLIEKRMIAKTQEVFDEIEALTTP
jgi:multidrug resistance efflux pump